MDCGIAREALSAAMDGEAVPGLAMTDVDRHVQGCAPCARWQDRAARINRLAVLSPAGEERDLTDEVLAKAVLPAGEPRPVDTAALAQTSSRPSLLYILVRIGLVLAAVAQAAVAIVELLGQDDPMMTMAGHMDHETSAFNFAIGVVLAFVAADPRRARPQLPLLGSVVGVLVLVSTFDLGAHAVGWNRLVTHIPLAVGLILVAALGSNTGSGTNRSSGTTGTATDVRTRRFPMRTAKRLGVLGSIVVGGLLAVTGSAYAHVTAQPGTATQGSYTKIAFRVPNEEDKASTVKLEVTFPTDHPIASVEVKDVPGWTAQIDKSTLATPLKSDDGPITEAVSKITWSGGSLAPDHFAEFEVSMGPLPTDTDKLVFKAVQTYDNGDVVRWIDTSAPGGAEPEHPAPTVQLTAKNASTAAAVTPTADTNSTSDSSLPLAFGIAGIVIGLAAGGLAVAALRRGRAAE
ncbi:DUF1775 domain-containing protein [Kutzneria sp. CA-103260]|uniref:DUF1775 domain-containing protein n=1 Tax=Kutzneria sp. CA-103260 TaxID=2802641 RepID=UPI001BA46103|nr:DUF1775 domain-containing protein [Kutzneria sp. CA-103260]QUQ63177.1 hypothetical protein JJ691_08890 [Kutzneria sp. CA-103260]